MSRRRARKRYHRPGTAPGTLVAVEGAAQVRVTVLDYGPEHFEEKTVTRAHDLLQYKQSATTTWINIDGLSDVAFLHELGELFGFHPLTLEDVLNCGQRPKIEDYGAYHFLVMRSLRLKEQLELETEQISFFLGPGFVITIQEIPGDSFEAVRERIRKGGMRIRTMGPSYLLYALIDALVDELFPALEAFGERLESLEEEVLKRPTPQTLTEINRIKRELLLLRRAAWPEREVIAAFEREESHLIHADTRVFLRDCYDHVIQAIDMVETYRDLAGSLLEVYLSSVSNRMNEVMKVLTIISTIFIPLSFIAGLYGMNFDRASPLNMPELGWSWGYPFSLLLMLAVAGVMVIYFRRKKWF